jgi:hypothetical protein
LSGTFDVTVETFGVFLVFGMVLGVSRAVDDFVNFLGKNIVFKVDFLISSVAQVFALVPVDFDSGILLILIDGFHVLEVEFEA